MPRRVHDVQPAERRQHVAVKQRLRVGDRPGQVRDELTGHRIRDHLADPDAKTRRVRRVNVDRRAGRCGHFRHASDVIGMAVGAHDPRDVAPRAADALQVALHEPPRAAVPGVDERDLVLDDGVRLRADDPHRVHAGNDLQTATSEAVADAAAGPR